MNSFLAQILTVIISEGLKAFSLPMAMSIVNGWAKLYTSTIASQEGKERREEVRSDMHEQTTTSLAQGYSPTQVAFQILFRWLTGIPDDVVWNLPFTQKILSKKTNEGIVAVKNSWIPKNVIPSLAILAMTNCALLSSSSTETFVEWLVLNCSVLLAIFLALNYQKPWVRRIIYVALATGSIFGLALIVGLTLKFNLYQDPTYWIYTLGLFGFGIGMLIAEKSMRKRLFKGSWILVVASWLAIGTLSLSLSWVIFGNLIPLVESWALIVIFMVSLVVACSVFGLAATITWYGGATVARIISKL